MLDPISVISDPLELDPISVILYPLELNPISLILDTTRLDPLSMILDSQHKGSNIVAAADRPGRPDGRPFSLVAARIRLGFGMEVLRIRRWPPSPASPARRPRGVEDDAIRRAGRLRSLGTGTLRATGQRGAGSPSPRAPHVVREVSKTMRFAGSTCRAELGACTR